MATLKIWENTRHLDGQVVSRLIYIEDSEQHLYSEEWVKETYGRYSFNFTEKPYAELNGEVSINFAALEDFREHPLYDHLKKDYLPLKEEVFFAMMCELGEKVSYMQFNKLTDGFKPGSNLFYYSIAVFLNVNGGEEDAVCLHFIERNNSFFIIFNEVEELQIGYEEDAFIQSEKVNDFLKKELKSDK